VHILRTEVQFNISIAEIALIVNRNCLLRWYTFPWISI